MATPGSADADQACPNCNKKADFQPRGGSFGECRSRRVAACLGRGGARLSIAPASRRRRPREANWRHPSFARAGCTPGNAVSGLRHQA